MDCQWSERGRLPNDAADIRREIFMREQGFQNEFDALDEQCWHVLLMDGERAVGTARMFPDGVDTMHVGRVAVRRELRGGGCGALLLRTCCEKAKQMGFRRVVLGAQCRAAGFYEKSGFQSYGEIYDDEGCPHQMMEKQL